ncbi:hypothetical protein EV182_007767, partial [Spiromyces aspiralis]
CLDKLHCAAERKGKTARCPACSREFNLTEDKAVISVTSLVHWLSHMEKARQSLDDNGINAVANQLEHLSVGRDNSSKPSDSNSEDIAEVLGDFIEEWDPLHEGELIAELQALLNETSFGRVGAGSVKTAKILELIGMIHEQHPDDKIIVFSNFTSYLDIIQSLMGVELGHIGHVRYDGSMSAKERQNVVTRFTRDSGTKVMLIS